MDARLARMEMALSAYAVDFLRERGYTFCMIEHDMEFISRLCDPVIVMAEGAVLATGSADAVRADEAVIEAYLGTGLKNKGPLNKASKKAISKAEGAGA